MAAMLVVPLAANVMTFALAWELMSLASYVLVLDGARADRDAAASAHAGWVYALMTHAGLACLLAGMLLLTAWTGSARFIDADARRDAPFAAYGILPLRVPVYETGDVWARTMVRIEEARQAAALIGDAAHRAPRGPVVAAPGPLRAGAHATGLVEGWRGPIWHWVLAAGPDSLARVKVVDPSFRNWPALEYAVLNNIVPDFPLCNKSFNLSYSGNDL